MAIGPIRITISIAIAWWVRPYLFLAGLVALCCGGEPDAEKVYRVVKRGLRAKVER
jgi:hypothetical protein